MKLAEQNNAKILPIDSEHSAIFQCLQGNAGNDIEKIMSTFFDAFGIRNYQSDKVNDFRFTKGYFKRGVE